MGDEDSERIRYPQPQNVPLDEVYRSNGLLEARRRQKEHGRYKYAAKYNRSKYSKRVP